MNNYVRPTCKFLHLSCSETGDAIHCHSTIVVIIPNDKILVLELKSPEIRPRSPNGIQRSQVARGIILFRNPE
jgi:hypothetical protein